MEDGTVYYLAQALADKVLGECSYKVLETYKGKDLEYKEYEPLYNFKELKKKSVLRCLRYLCNYERWYRCRSYRTGFR
mgnify:FL=1